MTKKEIIDLRNSFITNERLDEKSKRTTISYTNAINKFIDFIPDTFDLNKELLINYKDKLYNEGYAIKTRNQYIIVLNKFLKFADHSDLKLKKFKEQQKSSIDDIIEPQEHKRMLRWAKRLNMIDMYYIIEIFASVGIRLDELKYFTVENLQSNYIKGAYNKGKERTLIVTNELRRDLKHYCKENKIESGIIFRSPVDPTKMLSNRCIEKRLKKIAKKAKINPDKIHPHAWRHLFAKKCKESGIDLDELRDILGHKSIETTALYTMTSMKEKKEKLEKIRY